MDHGLISPKSFTNKMVLHPKEDLVPNKKQKTGKSNNKPAFCLLKLL